MTVAKVSAWVKVQNFQSPELSRLAVTPLNIYDFKFKWSIVFRLSLESQPQNPENFHPCICFDE